GLGRLPAGAAPGRSARRGAGGLASGRGRGRGGAGPARARRGAARRATDPRRRAPPPAPRRRRAGGAVHGGRRAEAAGPGSRREDADRAPPPGRADDGPLRGRGGERGVLDRAAVRSDSRQPRGRNHRADVPPRVPAARDPDQLRAPARGGAGDPDLHDGATRARRGRGDARQLRRPGPSLVRALPMAGPSKNLETFPNPSPDRDYEIAFAHFKIRYVPDQKCVELKSLKLYFWSYRNEGAFHEAVTNRIRDDLVAALAPRSLTVVGDWF